MSKFDKLFDNADNKADLFEKTYIATSFLRIYSIIMLILYFLLFLVAMGSYYIFSNFVSYPSTNSVFTGVGNIPPEILNSGFIVIAFVLFGFLLLSLFTNILTIWYTGVLMKEIKLKQIPNLVLTYIIFALYIILTVKSLQSLSILGILIKIIPIFLCYTIISSIKKIEKIN